MKPRVLVVDHVPHLRQQRSVIETVWPKDAKGYREPVADHNDGHIGRHVPGTLGRFPTVGIDEGAVKHTRPDTSPINRR